MTVLVKICGLGTPATVDAAVAAGADMIGFVFVAKSPRNVTPSLAGALAARVPASVRKVALVVDAPDAWLDEVAAAVRPDAWQLHGRETPERVRAVRARFGIPVIRAVGVAERADLDAVAAAVACADHVLVDAKPPRDAAYPGGHGRAFDWRILEEPHPALDPELSFMLSGGLQPANVGEAIRRLRPWAVDVSSGVETAPGVKDAGRIAAFVAAARAAAEAGIRAGASQE